VFPDDWTVDDLLGKHRSRPYNPLVANTFFRAGYIEAWGRGIEKIKESCIENGNDMAEYQVKPSEVMVVLYGLHDAAKGNIQDKIENTQDDTQENTQDDTQDMNDKERKILEYCKKPRSKKEIAEYLGYKTIKSIKDDVELLLADGKIIMTIPDKPRSKNQKYVTVKK
jgi:ATP-dependent DNA helicase RecG